MLQFFGGLLKNTLGGTLRTFDMNRQLFTSQDLYYRVNSGGETVNYCVDCNYLSTRVKGKNAQGFDGYCLKIKKNVYQTNRACKDFKQIAL